MSQRFFASAFADSVSGPETVSPCTQLRKPFVPTPCCIDETCIRYQSLIKVQRIPPWRENSR